MSKWRGMKPGEALDDQDKYLRILDEAIIRAKSNAPYSPSPEKEYWKEKLWEKN